MQPRTDTAGAPARRASPSAGEPRRLVINGAFRGQRITGQQRFAGELVQALLRGDLLTSWQVNERRPPAWLRGNRVLVWAWVQTLALLPRGTVLLSLTSRAPFLARRHVVVVHDLFVLRHPEWYRPLYRWTHALLLRLQLRRAALLAAVSTPVADELRRARPDAEVALVPNAPAWAFRVGPASDTVDKQPYFLAVGSLEPRKNLPVLLRAYGRLSDAERTAHPLLVVGATGAAFRSAGLPPIPDGVELRGYVSDDELADLYRRARAVLFLSLDEGFGLPAVEALACGAVVIASDIPVFHWVCGDLATFVAPDSVPEIAAALRGAIAAGPSTPAERRERSEGIEERFAWTKSAARMADALELVLDGAT